MRVLGYIDVSPSPSSATLPPATVQSQITDYVHLSVQHPGTDTAPGIDIEADDDVDAVNANAMINGIYLSHTPENTTYLEIITSAVRRETAFGAYPVVVHAPASPASASSLDYKTPAFPPNARPNITIVFDGVLGDLPSRPALHVLRSGMGVRREEVGVIVRGLKGDMGRVGLRRVVERVRRDVEWVWVGGGEEGDNKVLGEWLDVLW